MKIKKALKFIGIGILIIALVFGMLFILLFGSNYGDGFHNSSFTKNMLGNKTAMVIVPHQDDEINLAGSTIANLRDNGNRVLVVFATNGDYRKNGEQRIKEAVSAAESLGVDKNDVIFLGYGDQWDKKYMHIYNLPDAQLVQSAVGKDSTYAYGDIQEFRWKKYGVHAKYNRGNYKADIKDVIMTYSPDIIFCNDYDDNSDHRSLSLMFEEGMGEILKEHEEYDPIVYKGFCYSTAWYAVDDFYNINIQSTLKPSVNKLYNRNYETDMPVYNWKDRVRFLANKKTLTYTKNSNIIYQALNRHASQIANAHAGRIINGDQVFFKRNTNSLTYTSNIKVSSGEGKYINDFKMVDSIEVRSNSGDFENCVWMPSDDAKTVRVTFGSPQTINTVALYDNFSLSDNIMQGELLFSDGSTVEVGALNTNGSQTLVEFPEKNNIEYVEFKIKNYVGDNPGLCELEIYNTLPEEKEIKYIKLMREDDNNNFIYKYTVTQETDIPLQVYSYPNTPAEYKITLLNGDENVTFENNIFHIKDGAKPKSYYIRAELASNPEIYDQIEICIPREYEKARYQILSSFGKGIINISSRIGKLIK